MKKPLLLLVISFSSLITFSQEKKVEPKKQNAFNKQEQAKKVLRDSAMYNLKAEDSVRAVTDSIADFKKDSTSKAYIESGTLFIDSSSAANASQMFANRENQSKADFAQRNVLSKTKLKGAKYNQVKLINTLYTQKANDIVANSNGEIPTQTLAALNNERREKLRAILGKSKERKLEKDRISVEKNYSEPLATSWMNNSEK
jgi:hypothetical protein